MTNKTTTKIEEVDGIHFIYIYIFSSRLQRLVSSQMSIPRVARRRTTPPLHHLLLCIIPVLLLLVLGAYSLPCDDQRCKTGSCDDAGACICHLPDPSTILDGDRPFLGGSFCDEEQVMCDGTNSFWCEHGATCNEIIQGENYTCSCPPGYAGIHCEHVGSPCGPIYCFHEAECLVDVEGHVCECPPHWKGSIDCSMPSRIYTAANSSASLSRDREKSDRKKWFSVAFAVAFCVAIGVGIIVLTQKHLKKREAAVPQFQQLSQLQADDFLDDEEEDSLAPSATVNDDSHL